MPLLKRTAPRLTACWGSRISSTVSPTGRFAGGRLAEISLTMSPSIQEGRLWVAEFLNNRVLRFDNAAFKQDGADADGVLGQPDFISSTPATTWDGMIFAHGIVSGHGGAAMGCRLFQQPPAALRIRRRQAKRRSRRRRAGAGRLCQQQLCLLRRRDVLPTGVSGDPYGRIYVADSKNNRILIFDQAAALADGGEASGLLGQPLLHHLHSQPLGQVSAASLYYPYGVFFDPAYNVLWAADSWNNRVFMYGAPSRRASLVLGQPGFTSRIWATSQTGMSTPSGVAVDPTTGKVFVADENNHRVLRFASVAALTSGAAAEAVLGQEDFLSAQPNHGWYIPSADTICDPAGITIDQAGRLWVADSCNHRILRFDHAAAKENGADSGLRAGTAEFHK